jgi:hypothetical protein
MTEKNFEDFLKKAAKSYNAPPARTPREEMWSAIEASRSARPRVVYGGASVAPVTAPRRYGTRVWMGAAAAAMLLVATGVGIGRFTARSTEPAAQRSVPLIQTSPVVVGTGDAQSTASEQPGSRVLASGAGGRTTRSPDNSIATTQRTGERATSRAGLPRNVEESVRSPSVRGPSSAYQLATMQHLSEAEALLTSFRARSPADQQMDAQLGSWARQLLSNTRLLLDSPVANDPQRRPLLEDLELVLVQIVQLSPGSTPQDRELIEKTLQHDHVMTRLRTAIPAGPQQGS